jgi:hypothetical protein
VHAVFVRRIDIDNWKAGPTLVLLNADAIISAEVMNGSNGDYTVIRVSGSESRITVLETLKDLSRICGARGD